MDELRAAWRAAERLGFDWVSIFDHFYPATVPFDGDCFEGLTCHAALAADTSAVRVGSLVYSAGYRHPAVLANAAVTIDHLSRGRLELGLGAGWFEPEYRAYGLSFEPPAARLRRLREAVEVIRLLWTEERVDYEGEFFTLREALCNPKPFQARPRIWVGASGEKVGLQLAAAVGDGWNTPFPSPEDFARKAAIVRDAAPDPDKFEIAVNLGLLDVPSKEFDAALRARWGPGADAVRPSILHGGRDRIVENVHQYIGAGAGWVILALRAPFDLEALAMFANEVLPVFRAPEAPTTSSTAAGPVSS